MNVLDNNISTFFLLLFFFRNSSDKLKIYINKSVFMKKREKIMKGFWIFYVLEAMTCLMHQLA